MINLLATVTWAKQALHAQLCKLSFYYQNGFKLRLFVFAHKKVLALNVYDVAKGKEARRLFYDFLILIAFFVAILVLL